MSDEVDTAEEAPLRGWLEALVSSMGEVATSFQLGPLRAVDSSPAPPTMRGAFVSLLGEMTSLEVGVASTAEGCRRLAATLAGVSPEAVSEADIEDALGEFANQCSGSAKRALVGPATSLVIGLPTFVEGRFRKSRAAEAVARVFIGEIETWLVVQRFPSAPEVKAQRKAERELRLAHEQLERTSSLLREVFRAMPEGLVVTDAQQVITSVNPALAALFDCAEADLLGRPLGTLFDGAEPTRVLAALPPVLEHAAWFIRSRSDARIPVEVSATTMTEADGRLTRIVALIKDVRARQKLEFELRQAQKLEAVGRLAAGLAHEINTPMQFIGDSITFLREAATELLAEVSKRPAPSTIDDGELEFLKENVPKAFDLSIDGLGRVSAIVRSMKAFSNPDQSGSTVVDLNQAIKNALVLSRNECGRVAETTEDLGEVPTVVGHPGDLSQALLNIILNAAQAIEEAVKDTDARGRITIKTRSEQRHVFITISDTGTGIAPQIRHRIYEPFFTTREVGRGMGQGLTVARAVLVDQHGGTLDFESEVGKGTTFLIRVPVTQDVRP